MLLLLLMLLGTLFFLCMMSGGVCVLVCVCLIYLINLYVTCVCDIPVCVMMSGVILPPV